jgi:hypothetical protein
VDESETLCEDPASRLMCELAAAALQLGHFQLAYLLDTSRGDICRQMRREADFLDRILAEMMREPGQVVLAA